MTTFRDLGVLPETAAALEAVGITEPFPIQQLTLPVALAGTDIIGQAKTGTGKTLGFGIPLLQRIAAPVDAEPGDGRPQALVVVPTRELCVQVCHDLEVAGRTRDVRVLAVYGGRAYEPQVDALKRGVEVVVGTPGRLLDLAGQRKLDLGNVRVLVLDEADEMLDLGFLPDVEKIVTMLPAARQTMLFSATMPGQVIALARRYMSRPTHIRAIDPTDDGATVAATEQHVFRAHAMDKVEMVARMLQAPGRGLTMVFCRTKRTAAKVAEELSDRGFATAAVHGDLGQGAREQALRAFRNGKVDVLVATDVAARGIDVEDVTHVVNLQCPEDEKVYLHRIGRTGRAGKSGIAVTFVDWDDVPRWMLINKALGLDFHEPPETYSTSPHFFAALGIPENVTGILPRTARVRAGLAAEEVEDVGETGRRSSSGGHGGGSRARTRGGSPDGDAAAPRGHGGRRRDGSHPDGADASRDGDADGPRAPRRSRGRRRLRAGVPLGDQAAANHGADAAVTAVAEHAPPEAAPPATNDAGTAGGTATRPRPRRRRRRGGGGHQASIPGQQQAAADAEDRADGSTASTGAGAATGG